MMTKKHILSKLQFDDITWEIGLELRSAQTKFPHWSDDIIHGVSIMSEEAGEAVKAANQVYWDKLPIDELRKELIQTAAMCVRNIAHIDNQISLKKERTVYDE